MSSIEVANKNHAISAARFNRDEIDTIKQTVAKGTTDAELALFVKVCENTKLNPFTKQIYCIKRKVWQDQGYVEVMTIQTSIDGFRVTAERSGKYAGQVGPEWCGADGIWKDVWLDAKPPAAARVGILRRNFANPIYGVARFEAYAQRKKDGALMGLWAKMPDVMIAKCAEALALRKAFPQDLSGIYTEEEMEQAANPPRDVTEDAEPRTIAKDDADPVGTARAQSLAMLFTKKFGPMERDARMEQAHRVLGHPVESFKGLTKDEAAVLFARWGEMPDYSKGHPAYPPAPHPDYVPTAREATSEAEGEGADQAEPPNTAAVHSAPEPDDLPFDAEPMTLSEKVKDLAIELDVWMQGKGVRISEKGAEALGIEVGVASLADLVAIGKLEQLHDLLLATAKKKRAVAA